MHPKTTKLYKSLDHLGFWQEGLGYKDIYGGNKQQDQLSQNDKNAKLYKYVVQTEDRLYLFEWLLKRFQKDIFERYNEAQVEKSHYGDNIERIQRIKDILLDLGLLWTNRYAKSLDFSKVVEGISGTESSFHILYVLSKFVEGSTETIKAKEEVEGFDTLSELIRNKDTLVNQKLSLFPIDFPCKYDLTYEEVQKEVQNLKDEYQERLNKFEDLVVKYQEKCEGTDGQIVYANENTKNAYARSLNKFKEELFSFVEEYKIKKYKVKNMITRMESNKIGIPEELPELIDNISKRHSEVLEGTRLLESVDLDEKIDQLEASLQKLNRS